MRSWKRALTTSMLLVAVGAGPLARAEDKQADSLKPNDALWAAELAKLKGSWRAVRGELAGEPRKESFRFTVGDATWTKTGEKTTESGVFHINPSTNPKQIDILKEVGKKKWLPGIYLLEGDTLRICYGLERPQELTTKAGQNFLLIEFRREAAVSGQEHHDK